MFQAITGPLSGANRDQPGFVIGGFRSDHLGVVQVTTGGQNHGPSSYVILVTGPVVAQGYPHLSVGLPGQFNCPGQCQNFTTQLFKLRLENIVDHTMTHPLVDVPGSFPGPHRLNAFKFNALVMKPLDVLGTVVDVVAPDP